MGLKTIYTVTDAKKIPSWWNGRVGRITPQMIKTEVPDYKNCVFYISGPKGMIDSFKASLSQLHVHESRIKTDFFMGLA